MLRFITSSSFISNSALSVVSSAHTWMLLHVCGGSLVWSGYRSNVHAWFHTSVMSRKLKEMRTAVLCFYFWSMNVSLALFLSLAHSHHFQTKSCQWPSNTKERANGTVKTLISHMASFLVYFQPESEMSTTAEDCSSEVSFIIMSSSSWLSFCCFRLLLLVRESVVCCGSSSLQIMFCCFYDLQESVIVLVDNVSKHQCTVDVRQMRKKDIVAKHFSLVFGKKYLKLLKSISNHVTRVEKKIFSPVSWKII